MAEWLAEDAHRTFSLSRPKLGSVTDANEATTRIHVIDTMLFEVLRWERIAVIAEQHCRESGYADYYASQLSTVVEAKRAGAYFLLPQRAYPVEPIPFGLLVKECRVAGDAMRQAQQYAASLGARYSAITNGHQWLLALTFVPNQRIDERLVFVFESLDAIDAKFRSFFETFSPLALSTNLPSQSLIDARRAPPPPKLSTTIVGFPLPAERNVIINTLRPVLQLVWDESNANQDSAVFLDKCYIRPDPASDILRIAKELLEQRVSTDEGVRAAAEHADGAKIIAAGRNAAADHPVVILGRIGHGKSTFLRYLRTIVAREVLGQSYIQIDIDFVDQPATASEVPDFIIQSIETQLTESYGVDLYSDHFVRHALRPELLAFRRTPRGTLLEKEEEEYRRAEVDYIESFTTNRFRYLSYVLISK